MHNVGTKSERRQVGDVGLDGNNFKIDLKHMKYEGMEWIHLAQDSVQ
jgi:hypothetical protein